MQSPGRAIVIPRMANEARAGQAKKVLLIFARVGAGHRQAALALKEGIQSAVPDLHVQLEDVLDHAPWPFHLYYHSGYVLGMTRLPRVYGLGFDLTNVPDRPGRRLSERVRLRSERFWLRSFAEKVAQWAPDLVVNTHFLTAPVIRDLISRGRLNAKQMVVVTDHDMHRWWYSENVDQWLLPDELSRAKLRRWGIPAERMTVTGIPIHAKWTRPLDRRKIHADWGLPPDRPIVILTGGTEFTCGPIVNIALGILRACAEAHVVVLAGRDKKLLARLSRLGEAGRRLTPVSFTDRVHELVEICSLMVTKPGGITTTECCCKGAPMVLLQPVPGQEACNARHLRAHGAAVIPGGAVKIIETVRRLLGRPDELARMSKCAKSLYSPATSIIVEAISRMLTSPAG